MIHETFSETFNYSKEYGNITVNFDGACTPCNPNGDMGFGWCITDSSTGTLIAEGWGYEIKDRQYTTNNIAEWYSLYYGLKWIIDNNITYKAIKVYGDSKMVINQCKGWYKINPGKAYSFIAYRYLKEIKLLINPYHIDYYWIPRDQNDYCDMLSNKFIEHIKNLTA